MVLLDTWTALKGSVLVPLILTFSGHPMTPLVAVSPVFVMRSVTKTSHNMTKGNSEVQHYSGCWLCASARDGAGPWAQERARRTSRGSAAFKQFQSVKSQSYAFGHGRKAQNCHRSRGVAPSCMCGARVHACESPDRPQTCLKAFTQDQTQWGSTRSSTREADLKGAAPAVGETLTTRFDRL